MTRRTSRTADDETLDHLAQRFNWRADNIYRGASAENSSPLYEHLSRQVAKDRQILNLVRNADRNTQIENLLFGAVHFLLLDGIVHPLAHFYASLSASPQPPHDAYPDFRDFCLEQAAAIERLVTNQRVQTNEVRRCTGLLPAFQLISSRHPGTSLALIEIGPSIGLNLLWDRYRYDYGMAGQAGEEGSSVYLQCETRGAQLPPISTTFPAVASRVGIDLRPIDVADEAAIRWVRALIWPEHTDRAMQLMEAVAVARKNTPTLLAGDVLEVLPDAFTHTGPEPILCIYHSYTLNQCSQQTRDRVAEMLVELSQLQDFYRVSLEWYSGQEQPHLELYSYRNGSVQSEHLAYCESHGRWIEWVHC